MEQLTQDEITKIYAEMELVGESLQRGKNQRPLMKQHFRKAHPLEGKALLIILTLRNFRKASQVIYLGIILIWELMQGETTTLEKEFPDVARALGNKYIQETGIAMQQLLAVQEQLRNLEQRIAAPAAPLALPKPLDDLEDTVQVQAADLSKSGENPTYNMLISVASIDATGFIGLELEVLEYGVKQGKIDPKWLELKQQKSPKDKNPRQIAGANASMSDPELEIDLDW